MLDLTKMTTETRNNRTANLDIMTPMEIVTIMNEEDAKVPLAIKAVLPQISHAVEWATQSLRAGGRLIYVGAGTSGRLGVIDAVECPPTFGVSSEIVVGMIAGGEKAFVKAAEGAEDDIALGMEDLKNINLAPQDIVVGIAASGRTPYVISALEYAKTLGCHTVAIACNRNSDIGKTAQLAIEPIVGPEVLTGSTRLKAGTAQKMVLNMISTASMVGIGKTYHNLMVDVIQTNEKLQIRAQNILIEATDVDRETAKRLLLEANGSVKRAIVMALRGCNAQQAQEKLDHTQGHVRSALQ